MSTRTWSTCATCDGLVVITDGWDQVNHPACKRDTRSALAADYRTAVGRGDDAEADRLEATLDSHDRDDRNRSLGKTALWYARRGWPCFPLRPGDKRPLTEHGVKDATTDLDVIREWWRHTPAANIGVATGVAFDVIDVDWQDKSGNPSGAIHTWPALRDSAALPDIHGVAITPRSGLHILTVPDREGHNTAGKVRDAEYGTVTLPGIDYRGLGGYVVVAPSRYADGRAWSWVVRPSPRITHRPDWPNGAAGADQPPVDDTPMRDRPPVYDPDTGQQMNIWRVTGQCLDERWKATEWWQGPYRPPRRRSAS
jgi:hypothetical protein